MRASSCALAVATFMTTFWNGAGAVYPKTELLKFLAENCNDANGGFSAELINNNKVGGFMYEKAGHSDKDVVDLLLKEIPPYPPGANPHMICEYDLGIEVIGDGSVFCSPHTISLEVYNDDENEQKMRLIVLFQSEESGRVLKLYIPVLEVPSEYRIQLADLLDFATDNQLELISPFGNEDLMSIVEDEPISIHFGWLDRLVSYGLYSYRLERAALNEYTAWTRPLVMQPEFIETFVNVWNQCKGTKDIGSSSHGEHNEEISKKPKLS